MRDIQTLCCSILTSATASKTSRAPVDQGRLTILSIAIVALLFGVLLPDVQAQDDRPILQPKQLQIPAFKLPAGVKLVCAQEAMSGFAAGKYKDKPTCGKAKTTLDKAAIANRTARCTAFCTPTGCTPNLLNTKQAAAASACRGPNQKTKEWYRSARAPFTCQCVVKK